MSDENPNTNLVKWGTYEPGTAQEERDEVKKLAGSGRLKLAVGRNVVRILPPPVGSRSPFIKTMKHYYNPEGADGVFFNCPRAMLKKACPACAVADRLAATGNPVDQKKAEDWQPRLNIMTVVIDRQNPEAGPQILNLSKTVFDSLTTLRDDPEVGVDYTDPINGFDVIITRTGTGKKDTRYSTVVARRSSELGNLEWLEARPNIGREVLVPTAKEIVEMFEEAGHGELLRSLLETPTNRPAPQRSAPRPQGQAPAAEKPAPRTAPVDVTSVAGDDDIAF